MSATPESSRSRASRSYFNFCSRGFTPIDDGDSSRLRAFVAGHFVRLFAADDPALKVRPSTKKKAKGIRKTAKVFFERKVFRGAPEGHAARERTYRATVLRELTGALTGATLKLVNLNGVERITVPLCLALGWVVVFAFKPLLDKASGFGFGMILLGGLLYTVGTAFYACKRLPFQNAIWHAFVLAAAICHFSAVLYDVALMPVTAS